MYVASRPRWAVQVQNASLRSGWRTVYQFESRRAADHHACALWCGARVVEVPPWESER